MANNEFLWDKNRFTDPFGKERKKDRKDRYDNISGWTGEPSGIVNDTEDILRQSRENDNTIGEAAKQLAKPAPALNIPEVSALKPQPRTVIPPVRIETDKPESSSSLFNYGTKAVDTTPPAAEKRAKAYEDNLSTSGGNEGYTVPPIQITKQITKGKNESDPDEKQKLEENAANEGFSIGETSLEDSRRRIEETTAFLGKLFRGNEEQNRFANGIPEKGEDYQSVMGTYLDAKNESDNVLEEDSAKSINDLEKSTYGQGVMDIYHSTAAGGYDLGNGLLRGAQMVEPYIKPHYQMPWRSGPTYTDPQTKTEYRYDPTGYKLYETRQRFRKWAKEHEEARSEDFNKAGMTDPGYLGIKGAGTVGQDLTSLLLTSWIISKLGPVGGAATLALGALGGKGKSYDEHMDEHMAKQEEDMWKNEAYVQMRKDGLSERQARFAIGDKHARMNTDAQALAGAVKAFVASIFARATRDGSEGLGTITGQDILVDHGIDLLIDKKGDKTNNTDN